MKEADLKHRVEAVNLGRVMMHQYKVFDHVVHKQDFADEEYFYHFLSELPRQ